MKKHKFIIELEIPDKVNITEMKNYIHNAVAYRWEYSEVNLNKKAIKVVHATRSKAADLLGELKGKRNISIAAAQIKNYGGKENDRS